MRLLELFESIKGDKNATFCFGRMNPPTIGHKQLLDTVSNQGGDYFIFPSRPTPKSKAQKLANPLSNEDKIKFLQLINPEHSRHIIDEPNLTTFLSVCSYLYSRGYNHVTIVAGNDKLDELVGLCKQYNGVEGKAHGYYKFETVDKKSSGSRDPDGEGVASISGTKAREAAEKGDIEEFRKITGSGEHAEEMLNAVRKGLGIKHES
jgi:hypothetical protein